MFFHYREKDFVGDCFSKGWTKTQLGKQSLLKTIWNLFLNSVLLKILLNFLMVFLSSKAKKLKLEASLKKTHTHAQNHPNKKTTHSNKRRIVNLYNILTLVINCFQHHYILMEWLVSFCPLILMVL